MITQYFHTIDETNQVSLKVEEKIDKKSQRRDGGRGFRGKSKTMTTRVSEKE